jgi:hypothetical protein
LAEQVWSRFVVRTKHQQWLWWWGKPSYKYYKQSPVTYTIIHNIYIYATYEPVLSGGLTLGFATFCFPFLTRIAACWCETMVTKETMAHPCSKNSRQAIMQFSSRTQVSYDSSMWANVLCKKCGIELRLCRPSSRVQHAPKLLLRFLRHAPNEKEEHHMKSVPSCAIASLTAFEIIGC